MASRAPYRAAAVLLAALCLPACKAGPDLNDYEPRGVAEVREARRLAENEPETLTRTEALAKYRACTREVATRETPTGRRVPGDPQVECARWMENAYPAARNARNRTPKPGSDLPIPDALLKARHAPVESLRP